MSGKPHLWMAAMALCATSGVGAFDFPTGCGEGMGETVVLSQPSASDVLTVPTQGDSIPELGIESGYHRRFEMHELDDRYLALAFRRGAVTLAGGFAQFGSSDLYAEKKLRFLCAYRYGAVSLGCAASGMLVEFGGPYGDLSAATIALGGGVSYRRWRGAFMIENLTSPRLDSHSEPIRPVGNFFIELMGAGSYSLTGRAAVEEGRKPRFGFGQIVRLSHAAAFFWGVSTEPIKYGGGVQLSIKATDMTYATSYHPTLGFSQTVSLSLRIGGAR